VTREPAEQTTLRAAGFVTPEQLPYPADVGYRAARSAVFRPRTFRAWLVKGPRRSGRAGGQCPDTEGPHRTGPLRFGSRWGSKGGA
jgi:hypothetical protein